jgi:hypothetical protein
MHQRIKSLSPTSRLLICLINRGTAAFDFSRCITDRVAFALVLLATMVAALVLHFVPADPARLKLFTKEQVEAYGMTDSTPQRLAFTIYVAILLVSAVILRMFQPAISVYSGAAYQAGRQRAAALIFLFAALVNIRGLFHYGVPHRPVEFAALVALYLSYSAGVAIFIWSSQLPARFVKSAACVILFIALAPAASGLMLRVDEADLPWVDHHLAALFSSADLLAAGYRPFVDVSLEYANGAVPSCDLLPFHHRCSDARSQGRQCRADRGGVFGLLVPLSLTAAIRAGHRLDLGSFVHQSHFP